VKHSFKFYFNCFLFSEKIIEKMLSFPVHTSSPKTIFFDQNHTIKNLTHFSQKSYYSEVMTKN